MEKIEFIQHADYREYKDLTIEQIRAYLSHRPPFLLVDRVLLIEGRGKMENGVVKGGEGTRIVARKCVTYNEPHFLGHFPNYSIMPGVLITEAMAQAASFVLFPHFLDMHGGVLAENMKCVLVGLDGVRFRRPVVPGDVLTLECKVTKIRGDIWITDCKATVDGQPAAEAKMMASWVH